MTNWQVNDLAFVCPSMRVVEIVQYLNKTTVEVKATKFSGGRLGKLKRDLWASGRVDSVQISSLMPLSDEDVEVVLLDRLGIKADYEEW